MQSLGYLRHRRQQILHCVGENSTSFFKSHFIWSYGHMVIWHQPYELPHIKESYRFQGVIYGEYIASFLNSKDHVYGGVLS